MTAGPRVTAFIGIGSNLGDSLANVEAAIAQLDRLPDTRLTAQSSLFQTGPIDADGGDYINAAAQIDTGLPAADLLRELQALENASGRQRPYPNAPRELDLDLLLYGQQKINSDALTIPHPRLTQRAFVLIPLLQIDPFLEIPGKGPAHTFVPGVMQQSIRKI
jgi:2-amino-4-hydroxy-6-hydroxymethyldihydropteridine diphosphokinase